MGITVQIVAELMTAGLSGEALLDALRRIEAAACPPDNPPDNPPDKVDAHERRKAWDREYRRQKRANVHPTSTRHPPDAGGDYRGGFFFNTYRFE